MAEHRAAVRRSDGRRGRRVRLPRRAEAQAPAVLQRMGLEWLFRLATEPRRLWRGISRQNPRFVVLFGRQLLLERISRLRGGRPNDRRAR